MNALSCVLNARNETYYQVHYYVMYINVNLIKIQFCAKILFKEETTCRNTK